MSVTLYEAALTRLLNTELGVVGAFVDHKTKKIRDEVAASASDYFASAPGLAESMASDVSSQMEGSTGVITITPGGTGQKWSRLILMSQIGSWRNRPEVILQHNRF